MKIKILAHWLRRSGGSGFYPAECGIIEVIIGFIKLVAETVVSIVKVDPKDGPV